MSYDESAFEAASQALHSSYSDSRLWAAEESFGDRIRARGTLKNALRILGPSDEAVQMELERDDAVAKLAVAEAALTTVRQQALNSQLALTQAWEAAGRDGSAGFGTSPEQVGPAVAQAVEEARGPREEIEITDSMVNTVALSFFGPSVVYDREKLRSALAEALQTR